MDTRDLMAIQQFCKHYDVPISFLNALKESELIEIITTEKKQYIRKKQIVIIEKMIRLHYELDIDVEVMDVVHNLLLQIESLHQDVSILRNRLNFYEND